MILSSTSGSVNQRNHSPITCSANYLAVLTASVNYVNSILVLTHHNHRYCYSQLDSAYDCLHSRDLQGEVWDRDGQLGVD